MNSSMFGLLRASHITSGLVPSPIQLDSPLLFFRDSPEKPQELQSISLSLISFQFQKKLMRSMSIQKTVLSFQDFTSREENGILKSYAYVSQKLWSLLAQCQSFISSLSKSVLNHHRTFINAHATTIQLDKVLHIWTPSCSMLI